MKLGVSVVSGAFAVLAVALLVHVVPWIGFTWLDEAIFVGYVVSGQPALSAAIGLLFLFIIGFAGAALAQWWSGGASPCVAFGRGFLTALGLYVASVCISNPFTKLFHGQFDGSIPVPVQQLMTSGGWVALLESLAGHIVFGLILGLFCWLSADRETVGLPGTRFSAGGASMD